MERQQRFSAAEALRRIMEDSDDETTSIPDEEDSEVDHLSKESTSDSDSSENNSDEGHLEVSTNEQHCPQPPRVIGRGRGRARGNRYASSNSVRGRARATAVANQDGPNRCPDPTHEGTLFTSKNGSQWYADPPASRRRGPHDIIRNRPGVRREAVSTTELDAFQKIFSPEIFDIIVRETNREAKRICEIWNQEHQDDNQRTWTETTLQEMKAFLGLLILSGVYRGRLEPLEDLWSQEHGRPIFTAVMSSNRFKAILRYFRFDDKRTREQRRSVDKLAPIRDIWEMFLAQLPKCITPGMDITVDEQLVAFRGKCPFRQYIPSKPAKYGVKIWWACDSTTSFPLSGEVYLGRQPGSAREENQGARVVMSLTNRWLKSGRNIVMDNFFTSVPLATNLLSQNTTIVGTIRKNKPDIPSQLTDSKGREENSTIFAFSDQLTLVSYVPKKKKVVTLLSTMHHDCAVEGPTKKPHVILHYNDFKGGVDNLDKLAATYTCRRKCNRWPLAVFFNMIDVGGIAAFVVWLYSHPDNLAKQQRLRRNFLIQLGRQLVEDCIQLRLCNPQALQKGARLSLKRLGYTISDSTLSNEPPAKRRCVLCPRVKDRKTKQLCAVCNRNVCKNHCTPGVMCSECL